MTLVFHFTWHSAVVGALIMLAAYCLLLVIYSYVDHPSVQAFIHGSDDYQRLKDQP
jgi:hypothetical protein